ncbi:unnamed protein product [Linum trigynum]|uniref:Uncharacterized protein n=1 Tax=Linum trigynum TaxID=586398 RepID=A0AAV2FEN2_9ROSI
MVDHLVKTLHDATPRGLVCIHQTPNHPGVEHDVMSRWLARVPPSVKPSLTKQDTSMAQGDIKWQARKTVKASSKLHQHQAVEQRLPRGCCTTVTKDDYK